MSISSRHGDLLDWSFGWPEKNRYCCFQIHTVCFNAASESWLLLLTSSTKYSALLEYLQYVIQIYLDANFVLPIYLRFDGEHLLTAKENNPHSMKLPLPCFTDGMVCSHLTRAPVPRLDLTWKLDFLCCILLLVIVFVLTFFNEHHICGRHNQ